MACAGALESVGKIACDENALCYQEDDAFTCVCKDTYSGDGWAAGTGCIEGYNKIRVTLIMIIQDCINHVERLKKSPSGIFL